MVHNDCECTIFQQLHVRLLSIITLYIEVIFMTLQLTKFDVLEKIEKERSYRTKNQGMNCNKNYDKYVVNTCMCT